MDLKLKEVAELLQVSQKTIYRWVKDKKIPCCRINHQYRFRSDEINQWAVSNKYEIGEVASDNNSTEPVTLSHSLGNGGIYYHVDGDDMTEVLADAIELINIPVGVDQKTVLAHLLRREEMAPTAVGSGIAFPHPRTPIVAEPGSESLSICFLNRAISGYSLDDIPIHTIIIILSSTQERHLRLLSRLSFICRQDKFIKLMENQALRGEIMDYVKTFEL